MRQLHPDLARLEAQYARLLSDVDDNRITVDQAHATLESLVTFDGAGNRWTVSPESEPPDTMFLCAPAGQQALVTPPEEFVVTDLPPRAPIDPATGFPINAAPTIPTGHDVSQMPFAGAPPGTHFPPGRDAPFPYHPEPAPAPVQKPPRARRTNVVDALVDFFSAHKVTALIVVIMVIAVVVAVTMNGQSSKKSPAASTSFTYDCQKMSAPVRGVPPGEVSTLLACLDSGATGASQTTGPLLASLVVTQDDSSHNVFDPGASVSRAAAIHAAMILYQRAGGELPTNPPPVDAPDVPDFYQPALASAVELGFISADQLFPTQSVSRGDLVALLATVLTQANVTLAPAGAPASDSQGIPAAFVDAQARLAASGIADTDPGAPFRFTQPATASDFVIMVGRAYYDIIHPGSMVTRLEEASTGFTTSSTTAPPASTPAAVKAPNGDQINKALSLLTSGKRDIASSAVVTPGDTKTIALRTAQYAGYKASGLTLSSASPAQATTANVAVSTLAVIDKGTSSTYATAKVSWKLTRGNWLLVTWPDLPTS